MSLLITYWTSNNSRIQILFKDISYSSICHVLEPKMSLSRFKKIEIIKGMFSDHNEIKLESCMRNLTRIYLKYLEIKQCRGQCEVLPPPIPGCREPTAGPPPQDARIFGWREPPPTPGAVAGHGGQLLGGAQVGGKAEVGSEYLLPQRQPALQPRPSPSQQPLLPFGAAEGWQGSEGRSWATADAFLQANSPSMSSGSSASSSVKGGLTRQRRWAVTHTWLWTQRPAHDEIRWVIVIATISTTRRLPSRTRGGLRAKESPVRPPSSSRSVSAELMGAGPSLVSNRWAAGSAWTWSNCRHRGQEFMQMAARSPTQGSYSPAQTGLRQD